MIKCAPKLCGCVCMMSPVIFYVHQKKIVFVMFLEPTHLLLPAMFPYSCRVLPVFVRFMHVCFSTKTFTCTPCRDAPPTPPS